jgi:GNAT superfamily N-acetyltransferase
VAVDQAGDVVGFAFVDLVDAAAHLCEMDVAPDHARQGIGTALVEAIAAWAAARGLTALTLTTFARLPWNAPFYEKLGFRTLPAGEITSGLARIRASEAAAGLDPDERVVMRRELGPT